MAYRMGQYVLTCALMLCLSSVADGCWFGTDETCTYQCHCEDEQEMCDADTGECDSGCDVNNRDGHMYSGDWSGPGCQVGNMAIEMDATQAPETYSSWEASLAVDGDINPDVTRVHCAHPTSTDNSDYASWTVTFSRTVVLSSVIVFNREETKNPNLDVRLHYTIVEVQVSSGDYVECGRIEDELTPNRSVIIVTCQSPLLADRLRLRRFGDGVEHHLMTLCEVFAMGYIHEDCGGFHFGPGCLAPCNCQGSCDELTGDCPGDCVAGKMGPMCQEDCPDTTWGVNCTNNCNCRDDSEICNKMTGSCASGCPAGMWGVACLNNCECRNRTEACDEATGFCQSGCDDDATGTECDGETSYPVGLIAGVVMGLLVIIIIILIICLRCKGREKKRPTGEAFYVNGAIEGSAEAVYENQTSGENVYVNSTQSTVPLDQAVPAGADENDEDLGMLTYVPVYSRPPPHSKPIKVADLGEYIKKIKSSSKGFKEEYESLPGMQTSPWDVALQPANQPKNRFKNIRAYDHSRVILRMKGDDGDASLYYNTSRMGGDYINASYISGYGDVPKAYIASQAPLATTVNDMWEMIWQENLNRIVMITNLVEGGRVKCEKYWPEREQSLTFGAFTVRTVNIDVFADFIIRKLSVTHLDQTRVILHFHFTGWPDHGVPAIAASLLDFHRKIKSRDGSSNSCDQRTGPLLVHCSAGIGRTGTFIAIDYLLNQAKAQGRVDVKKCVFRLRGSRIKMVQTLDQYMFVHNALLEALLCGETAVPANQMAANYQNVVPRVSMRKKKSKEEVQFKLLQLFYPPITNGDENPTGLEPANRNKNRTMESIPLSSSRVHLHTRVDGTTDYINAAYVGGYRRHNAYITTQMPLPTTICDIWRLLHDSKSSTLIMLNEHDPADTKSTIYWPEEAGAVLSFGPLSVTMISESDSDHPNIRLRDIQISNQNQMDDTPLIVRQFCLSGWPDSDDVPAVSTDLLSLIDLTERWQARSGSGPITIQCRDGVHHSGLFVAAFYLLEKLKVDQEVDVFQAVKQVRQSRPQFVINLAQYKQLHELAVEFIARNVSYSNFK